MVGNRLLIVGDDLATLDGLRALFERRGWRVVAARTAAEAFAACEATAPDWVLVDLKRPDGDDEEVLRRLRESGKPCRIAVASSTLEAERVARLREWKTDLILERPIDFVTLYSACIGIESALMPHPVAAVTPAGSSGNTPWRRGPRLSSTPR